MCPQFAVPESSEGGVRAGCAGKAPPSPDYYAAPCTTVDEE